MRTIVLTLLIILFFAPVVNADMCHQGDTLYVGMMSLDVRAIPQRLKRYARNQACAQWVVVARRHWCDNDPGEVTNGTNRACYTDNDCTGQATCVKRVLVDIQFKDKAKMTNVFQCLQGGGTPHPDCDTTYNPTALALHGYNGNHDTVSLPWTQARIDEYLRLMPDECTHYDTSDPENPVCDTWERPTVPKQLHKFFGWGDRTLL